MKKCQYPVHLVYDRIITVGNTMIKININWPILSDKHEIRYFSGICNYYLNQSSFQSKDENHNEDRIAQIQISDLM